MLCTSVFRAAIGLLWLTACGELFAAQSVSSQLQLSISDGRPVAKAIEILVQRHGLPITYEDPPYAFDQDLKDVTAEVARSPVKAGHRVLVPRGGVIQLTYSVSPSTGKLEYADAVLRRVLDAHVANGGGSQFELIQQDDVFHVVPVMVKSSAGAWIATRSVLDNPITVPVQPRSGTEMVDAICKALSAGRARVAVGMAPENALANGQVVEGGTNEPARDILSRSLKQLSTEAAKTFGAEQPYVWQLLFDPSSKMYFLNLSLIRSQPEPAKPEKDSPPDLTAPDPNTARPKR